MGYLKKRKEKRKNKKQSGDYSFWDVVLDVLLFLPEILALLFRLLGFVLRIIGKFIGDIL